MAALDNELGKNMKFLHKNVFKTDFIFFGAGMINKF